MQKKKEKFLDKIVKKDYNNELELILEEKSFDEDAKNILLTMLYKLETAYKDYEKVKQNVMPKDKFLQKIIDIINFKVDNIKIVKMNSEEAKILKDKTFLVDRQNKTIICYPIERKILYALCKISEKDKIVKNKYYVIDKTISDLLNIGNNINAVEPIRDFNGFSWDTVSKEIESLEYNLIYQILRILVGEEFLNNWIYNDEFIIDYFEVFVGKLQEYYGQNLADDLIEIICQLSVLLYIKYNQKNLTQLQNNKKDIEEKLEQINNKEIFIKESTREKKDLNKKIKNIDTILNDKVLLQKEYDKRNEVLPFDKKIFSMRVLSNIMKKEREKLIKQLEKVNDMLNPQKFVEYENKLEENYKYLKLLEVQNLTKEIDKLLIKLQVKFLECIKIKNQKSIAKDEILKLLFKFRYYLNLQYNKNKKIFQIKELNKRIEDTIQMLINRAIQEKIIVNISDDKEFNYNVLKNIFYTRIIDFSNINIKIINEDEKVYIQILDENIFDEKIELGELSQLNIDKLQLKFNKNIKIFNA